jgi:hypothetical protein
VPSPGAVLLSYPFVKAPPPGAGIGTACITLTDSCRPALMVAHAAAYPSTARRCGVITIWVVGYNFFRAPCSRHRSFCAAASDGGAVARRVHAPAAGTAVQVQALS